MNLPHQGERLPWLGSPPVSQYERPTPEELNEALYEQLADEENECGIVYDHDVPDGQSFCRNCGADLEVDDDA